jgi:hypothetical protein
VVVAAGGSSAGEGAAKAVATDKKAKAVPANTQAERMLRPRRKTDALPFVMCDKEYWSKISKPTVAERMAKQHAMKLTVW